MTAGSIHRPELVRRGQRLEYFTIGYNALEGVVSLGAGFVAGSDSLVGLGLDNLIEVTSGTAVFWRLSHDWNPSRREEVEQRSLRIVGACFIALAVYVLYEAGESLLRQEAPGRSGILIAAVSVVVMPVLARAKRRVAAAIESRTMLAHSR